MLFNVLHTDWILNVAAVAARLKSGLAGAKNRSERAWQLRSSDLRLLRADPGYVSRAGSNNVHFILARPAVNSPPDAYFDSCSRQGSPMNLIGTYTWFHTSAILKAQRIAAGNLNEDQFSLLACAALADEAFAIHFLEDGFASGHVAGIWGNAALRKGTHDYYDEYGLEVTTWQGARTVLTGDAYMRPADADRAAAAVTLSLEQLIDATDRKYTPPLFNDQPGVFVPDTFNIAHAVVMPFRQTDPAFRQLFDRVLMLTPVPGLATGLG